MFVQLRWMNSVMLFALCHPAFQQPHNDQLTLSTENLLHLPFLCWETQKCLRSDNYHLSSLFCRTQWWSHFIPIFPCISWSPTACCGNTGKQRQSLFSCSVHCVLMYHTAEALRHLFLFLFFYSLEIFLSQNIFLLLVAGPKAKIDDRTTALTTTTLSS